MTAIPLAAQRVRVLVDGQNLLGHLDQARHRRIDARAFSVWCQRFGRPAITWLQGSHPGTEPFFGHLRAEGIEVRTKTPKVLPGGRPKANMDIELCLEAIDALGIYDTLLLVTADGDFAPLVSYLRARGVGVHLLCPLDRVAHELLHVVAADNIHDLDDELPYFGFTPGAAA